jgi:formylglycine-generating enzyme required for sulfatase activity
MPAGKKSPTSADSKPRPAYKVFVSSTYLDNKERRRLVQDAITTAGMLWHGMELFTASTKPTVEECLRYAREADVLVGIIAWRYGWEPDGSEISITEMEYAAARERLMFLIDPSLPFTAEDFDPLPERWKKQDKLEAFKQRIQKDQMPALFKETTLQARVLKALNDWREAREKPESEEPVASRPTVPVSPAGDFDEGIRSYLLKAESLHAHLPVAGFATRLKVPIDIEDIYVPLRAMLDLRGVDDECFFADSADAEKKLCVRGAGLEISLPDAFTHVQKRGFRNILILGDPGSGKTTHLKRVLLYCLRKGPAEIGLPADILPVFLPLRNLQDLEKGLDAFIENELDSPHLKTPPGFGRRMLGRGNLLYLLDGLDEVADLTQRERVARWIVAAQEADPTSRFVVTCRFAGYSPGVHLGAAFLEMHLRPLTEEQVAAFVHNWYRVVEKGLAVDPDQAEGLAREKAENLIARLQEEDFRARRVFELTRNPLLLANICLVHRHRGALPQKRARLYEECIDVLLEHWQKAKGLSIDVTAQEGRRVLQPAALWLHGQEERTRATAEELAPQIAPALKAVGWQGGGAADFLRTIRDDSGLLTGWGPDHYGFMHLGFQEYLAAREIRRRGFNEPELLRELATHFGESWWQEVTLLLLALEEPSHFAAFMGEVVKKAAFANHPDWVDFCLDDAAETTPEPFTALLEKSPGKQKSLWRRQAAALRVLERLAPERIDALQEPLSRHPYEAIRRRLAERAAMAQMDVVFNPPDNYELVRIPAGSFLMGSPKNEKGRYDDEEPQHPVALPAFYLGRYPVTNAQYERFLKANLMAPKPRYWADRRFNQPRQPVVGVSWEDAQAYARWVGLRLPSEAEWEYACRAGTRFRFYTGEKDADLNRAGWYADNSEGNPHSVGEKEPNHFGLYDMHGNVWEWVEDDYHRTYDGAPVDGQPWVGDSRAAYRVLRGGGWGFDARRCRSAARGSYAPVNRYITFGFRLARSVFPGS